MNRKISRTRPLGLLLLSVLPGLTAGAARPEVAAETQRLRARTGAGTSVSVHPATDVARFVRVAPGSTASLSPQPAGSPEDQAQAFFTEHAALFGVRDARTELRLVDSRVDALGITRLTYAQVHAGVPVFAGVLRAHFDASGRLTAVNGTFVPDIDVPAQPTVALERAQRVALAHAVTPDPERPASDASPVRVVGGRLVIFRTGLVKGEPGQSHLAYQVEVSNGGDVHKDVFVDAHSGKYLDAYSRVMDALNRKSYDGAGSATAPGPNYPGTPFWVEGQVPFPTGTTEADNMIYASGETYNLFENAFAFDSGGLYPFFPATSGQMHSIFNRGWGCPNASWNSTYISFCPGFTTDDVTAHEWGHAYTEFSSNLIYAWQSGALNESYSDVYGEVVDLLNGRGLDTPGPTRTNLCSAFGGSSGTTELFVNTPPAIAGSKPAQPAQFGPVLNTTGITGNLVRVQDSTGGSDTACSFVGGIGNPGAIAGNIALIQRGTCVGCPSCTFVEKVTNAQAAGATGVVIYNNAANPTGLPPMGGTSGTITIPSVGILRVDGLAIIANSPANATMRSTGTPPTDNSLRWIVGEEVTGGAIRDMWKPGCFANPGRVGDTLYYVCGAGDNGGVHSNSGVPNHLFALLTDGGTFNGHTVAAIGMTKATHLFFRAQSQYLGPASNFADFADALEQSCVDLTGINLQTLSTGAPGGPSGQIIGAADCAALAQGLAAVELRTPPTFCNFTPLLNAAVPVLCPAGQVPSPFFAQSFESDPFSAGWAATTGPVGPNFVPRAWVWDSSLPGRAGSGVFAIDHPAGTCAAGGDNSGVIQLESPTFVLPAGAHRLAFDHWMASEATYDGGNLKISVNGGAFTVVPAANFTFNAYVGGLSGAGSNNPMFGQPGFSGTDGGSNGGSWGTSVVDLTGLATAGQSVKLRWDFGQDGCAAVVGWYLDNVNAFTCQAAGSGTPSISIGDVSLFEGDSGLSSATFNVTLAPADPSGPHAVNFTTQDGTAKASDSDYYTKGSTLVFAANETSKSVAIDVRGDTKAEPTELFTVALSNAVNATIGDGSGQGTIVDDDAVAGDFNGDGLPDLVFRSVPNGAQNKVWFMDGVTRTAEAAITPDAASTAWRIRGVNDFDNAASPGTGPDTKTDLVFWNQSTGNVEFWLMNGTARVGSPLALTGAPALATNWDLSATADFSHDGRPDIVWRNFTSQKIVIWKMGEGGAPGTQKTGNIIPTPDQAVDGNWIIVAAADYNNDGNTDFLWYNFTSGRIVTWYMDASVVRISGQFTTPNAAGDANWKVVASADYSRAYVPGTPPVGSPDIVWRNETSGNQVVWHLDFNSTRVHGQFTNPTANTPALDWVIVGPR